MSKFEPSDRTRLRRAHERGHYDKDTVYKILDSSLLAHIGYQIDGRPFVTPTFFWRNDDILYWHGSAASRMIRAQAQGIEVCLTVSHLDGLVLARSAFNHSANYRSVMAFGVTRLVTDIEEKKRELDRAVERMVPGRLSSLRPNHQQEIKATSLIAMEIKEAAAKIRSGPPEDDEDDYKSPLWAGIVEINQVIGKVIPDPLLAPGITEPDHLAIFKEGKDYSEFLEETK